MNTFSQNRLFERARQARLRWPASLVKLYPLAVILYALAAPFVAPVLMAIPLAVYFLFIKPGSGATIPLPDTAAGLSGLLVGGFAPIFFLVWLWVMLFERRSPWSVGLEGRDGPQKYLRGAFIGLGMAAAAVILPAALGFFRLEGDFTPSAWLSPAVILGIGWAVQGAAEEVLFRGFLFPILGVRYGAVAGVLISSGLFALLHLFNPNPSLLALLNLTLFGIFAALYAAREGSLWGIFAIHSAWNWALANVFGLEVSGLPLKVPSLVNLVENGPDWLTGGLFGPEGGAAVTLVLLVGILITGWCCRSGSRG